MSGAFSACTHGVMLATASSRWFTGSEAQRQLPPRHGIKDRVSSDADFT